MPRFFLLGLAFLAGVADQTPVFAAGTPPTAPKPLYRDPIHDGAADPTLIWNPHAKRWWMFYTNRRANVPGLSGVAWVHGTKIGLAESADQGATWTHAGPAEIELPAEVGGTEPTLWAPEVVTTPAGTHHMFLTVVPGVFANWEHPRRLVHLTSADLRKWTYASTLSLSSDRVIDACVSDLPGGGWRLWYNNERDGKSIYVAESRDLRRWVDRGKVTSMDVRGEGPDAFTWRGRHWMVVDTWRGLAVYRSRDFVNWERQPALLLDRPGRGADDGVVGGHASVVVSGTRAFCFYCTHPGRPFDRAGGPKPEENSPEWRRSSIQVVELFEQDGWITCERDQPTRIALLSPGERRSSSAEIAATDREPAEAAKLAARGSRDIRAHDPSMLAYSNGVFVNKDWCCRGVNSPYYITVGRAYRITGPYVDRDGRPMMDGGGTVFVETDGPVIGPGHASIQAIDGREWFGYHFYDGTQNGRATYGLRPLTWDPDGWPVVGKVDGRN